MKTDRTFGDVRSLPDVEEKGRKKGSLCGGVCFGISSLGTFGATQRMPERGIISFLPYSIRAKFSDASFDFALSQMGLYLKVKVLN